MSKNKTPDHKKLLLIFIHGFKGDDNTFMGFPERLCEVLSKSKTKLKTEWIVYPKYKTEGDLKKAIDTFCIWLEDEVKTHEDKIKALNRKGEVLVCLLGHSMGGILAADTILRFERQANPKPPKIIGLLAYDTPYYGVHGDVFSKAVLERATDVSQKVTSTFSMLTTAIAASGLMSSKTVTSTRAAVTSETATNIETCASSTASNTVKGGFKFSRLGVAALAGVALFGGVAYMHKDKVGKGVEWLGSHLEYVGVLWNYPELKQRMEKLMKVPNITFHCFYTQIPPNSAATSSRTFISLPPPEMLTYFSAISCVSQDEIGAHLSMFDPDSNPYYYDLGHVSSKRLIEMLDKWEILID